MKIHLISQQLFNAALRYIIHTKIYLIHTEGIIHEQWLYLLEIPHHIFTLLVIQHQYLHR